MKINFSAKDFSETYFLVLFKFTKPCIQAPGSFEMEILIKTLELICSFVSNSIKFATCEKEQMCVKWSVCRKACTDSLGWKLCTKCKFTPIFRSLAVMRTKFNATCNLCSSHRVSFTLTDFDLGLKFLLTFRYILLYPLSSHATLVLVTL